MTDNPIRPEPGADAFSTLPATGRPSESDRRPLSADQRLTFEQARADVESLLRITLSGADAALADIMDALADSRGKGIRAALLLAASTGADGLIPADAIRAAAALELLHLATLVHDDVIDDAPMRRGQPSVQQRFGKKTAVITGDYLLVLSLGLIAPLAERHRTTVETFTRTMGLLIAGEMKQHRHNRDTRLRVFSYLRIIAGKTAALFALALHGGSIIAGDDERCGRHLGRIGFNIGMLFQIVDDCLDYETSDTEMRKKTRHDLAAGVITLPLIYTLFRSPELAKALEDSGFAAPSVQTVIDATIRGGGLDRARSLANRYEQRATRLIGQLDLPRRQAIGELLQTIMARRN